MVYHQESRNQSTPSREKNITIVGIYLLTIRKDVNISCEIQAYTISMNHYVFVGNLHIMFNAQKKIVIVMYVLENLSTQRVVIIVNLWNDFW